MLNSQSWNSSIRALGKTRFVRSTSRQKCLLAALASGILAVPAYSESATYKIGTQETARYNDSEVLDSPRPEIPSELYEQGLKSSCVARFNIKKTGKFSVKLVNSSGSQEIDDIALKTLRQWKFRPATVDGAPVDSSRKIRVEFEFE